MEGDGRRWKLLTCSTPLTLRLRRRDSLRPVGLAARSGDGVCTAAALDAVGLGLIGSLFLLAAPSAPDTAAPGPVAAGPATAPTGPASVSPASTTSTATLATSAIAHCTLLAFGGEVDPKRRLVRKEGGERR